MYVFIARRRRAAQYISENVSRESRGNAGPAGRVTSRRPPGRGQQSVLSGGWTLGSAWFPRARGPLTSTRTERVVNRGGWGVDAGARPFQLSSAWDAAHCDHTCTVGIAGSTPTPTTPSVLGAGAVFTPVLMNRIRHVGRRPVDVDECAGWIATASDPLYSTSSGVVELGRRVGARARWSCRCLDDSQIGRCGRAARPMAWKDPDDAGVVRSHRARRCRRTSPNNSQERLCGEALQGLILLDAP
ncbi:hypothetical protein OH77DRAFT_377143 [Trametes cingulata]|nr:hypothetical protein OH77DRAFT_377143 [Trametes cingulata]